MERQSNSDCWYVDSCTEDCERCTVYTELKYQMENSGLPKAKQRPISLFLGQANREDTSSFLRLADIRENIVDFVQGGNNLYICSRQPGNGKTSWAIKMLHTYFHYMAQGNYDNLKGMFVLTSDLLLRLKDFNNPIPKSFKEHLENVDLVIWDDIAVAGISQYDYTQLYTILDKRILAEKSNIYTSNVTTLGDIQEILGARLASRIYNTSEIVEFVGKDMR